jgi:DNA-3-methyladenine glycosylase
MGNGSINWSGRRLAGKYTPVIEPREVPLRASARTSLGHRIVSVEELDASSILPVSFYERNTLSVAQDLLGKVLITKDRDGLTAGRIVETEAYRGDDPASHSCRGKTPRCSVMFGPPGVAYVYFIYGMYEMLNFVTEPIGSPGAVLIRALEPLQGESIMQKRRGRTRLQELTQGPGRLCQAMGIRMDHKGSSLNGPELLVCDDGHRPDKISQSGRIGIRLAQEKPWRFFIPGNKYVSKHRMERS